MKVALLANLKQNAPTWPEMPPERWDDLDSLETIQAISLALEAGGHEVVFLEGDETLYNNLDAVKPDICFNLCEGHFGDAREAQVPALLELRQIPYTGSRVLSLVLALDKPMTKRVLSYHNLPTPAFQVFERENDPLEPHLSFPLFVKPSQEETGMGINGDSIVRDEAQLRRRLRYSLDRFNQPALVEQFIEGLDVTVGVVGNLTTPVARQVPEDEAARRILRGLHFFPPLEVDMNAYPAQKAGTYTNQIKVDLAHNCRYICPAPLSESQVETLNWLTAATFRVLGCFDVARVDFRLDANDNDKPYILEVNPLPGLNPDSSDLCVAAKADGWRYDQLINHILDEAARRYRIEAEVKLL